MLLGGEQGMIVAKIQYQPQITILHHIDAAGLLWATRGRTILKGNPKQGWERVAHFPRAYPRDLFAFSRPTARAMRADKANLFVNSVGAALGIRAGVAYIVRPTAGVESLFPIRGDSVLHGGICEDHEGWTYFGEYFMNPAREEVRIYRLGPTLENWEIAHTFAAGQVRHVHGVYRDPFDAHALWVTCGDAAGECYLFRTRDRFKTLERIGEGTQLWRAVRLFFTREHVCWLTDSQLEQNHSCRWDRASSHLEIGQSLGAPAWYGSTTTEGLHLAFTTVEPGPAVQRTTAAVYVSKDAFTWQEVMQFQKDAWRPMKLFKYGVISCPSGKMSQEAIYISGEGLKGLDGISAVLTIEAGLTS
jgi:hypothetical protein